jgi:hypothetical protein
MNVWTILGALLVIVAGIAALHAAVRGHDSPPAEPAPDDSMRLSVDPSSRCTAADDDAAR